MDGYRDCACRDCFEIAIGAPGALCNTCTMGGCEPYPGEEHEVRGTNYECQADIYDLDDED